jgi:gliding motility-associated-like protein/uncharacterized repeat protein (TIGR01451 family)
VVTDAFAGGATLESGDETNPGVLDVGETWIYSADYQVTQSDIDAGTDLVNVASVTTEEAGPQQDDATTTISQGASLSVTKTADKASVSTAGELITYTISVANTGNVSLTNVVVTDAFAGGATLESGDETNPGVLDVGETWIYSADYQVTQADIDDGADLVNVASATSDQAGPQQDDATTTIVQNLSLVISKTASPNNFSLLGETITYTIELENLGNVTLTSVEITDPLTGFTTTIDSLKPETKETFVQNYNIVQDDLNAGSLSNTVTASGKDPNNNTITVSDTETISGNQTPRLAVDKNASPKSYSTAGDIITYTIDVENTGNVTISDIAVTDPLTALNTTIPSLNPGDKQTYTQTYTITQDDLNEGSLSNTATASGTDPSNNTITATDTETISGSQTPGLSVTKTASPKSYSSAGDIITYTIEVENTGNVTISSIAVVDTLTGLNTTVTSLAPQAKQSYSQTYTIKQTDMNAGSVSNTATASGIDPADNTVTASDTETISGIQTPRLSLTTTASPVNFDSAGVVITFSIIVENTGNVTISSVEINDALTGLNETIPALAPGARETITQTYTISQSDMDAGSITNTATATGNDPANNIVTASDTETITGNRAPAISVLNSASPASFNSVGEVITFTLTTENTGNVTLSSLTISDSLTGLNSTIPSLSPGEEQTFTQTYTIKQDDLDAGSLTNITTVIGRDPANNEVGASVSETINGNQAPGLAIIKSATPTSYSTVGEIITYSITAENTGNVTISSVVVTDSLTGLNTTIPTLAPGGKQTFSQNYTIKQSDLDAGIMSNTATVLGKDPATNTISANATETINGIQNPSLSIVKTAAPDTYSSVNEIITYAIEVENTGNVTISTIEVGDPLTSLNANIATLAPGEKQSYTQFYSVTQANINAGFISNTAFAIGKDPNNATVSTSITETATAIQNPGISVTKTADSISYDAVGDVIGYTIVIENTGNVSLNDIWVTDELTGMNTNVVILVPGTTRTFKETYSITQADLNSGNVVNTVSVSGKDPKNTELTASDTETVNAVQNPSLSVTKTSDIQSYEAVGEIINFTFEVENTGNVTVTDILLSDPITGFETTIENLEPGASETFENSFNINQSHLDSGSITNTVTVSGKDPLEGLVEASDAIVVTAIQNPEISVSKTVFPLLYAIAGNELTYTILVENTGNVTLSNVVVTDPLTGLDSAIVSLPPGEPQTFTQTYVITQADVDARNVINSVSVLGNSPDGEIVNSTDEVMADAYDPPGAVDDLSPDNIAGESSTVNILANDRLHGDSLATPGLVIVDINPNVEGAQTQLIMPGEGTWSYSSVTGDITFTPVSGFTTDPLPVTYILTENLTGLSDSAKVFAEYNEGEPFAIDDRSPEAEPGSSVIVNILENDRLSDNSSVAIDLITIVLIDPLTGQPTTTPNIVTVSGEGLWTYEPREGEITFIPVPGFTINPTPVFYQLTENLTGLADRGKVIIEYDRKPPFASDDNSLANTPGNSVTIDIITNDKLSDGSPALVGTVIIDINLLLPGSQTELAVAGQGNWSYNPSTGELTFNPTAGFTINPTPVSYSLTENLTGLKENAIVAIEYNIQPPLATDDVNSGNSPGDEVTVRILENDQLSDGTQASVEHVSIDLDPLTSGNQNTLVVSGEGIWVYAPASGELTFAPEPGFTINPSPVSYVLTEILTSLSSEAEVSIQYIQSSPFANDDLSTENESGSTVLMNILANDKLSDNTPAKPEFVTVDIDLVTNGTQIGLDVPDEGVWTYNPTAGNITFIPDGEFTGQPSSVRYSLTENLTGLRDTAIIAIEYFEEPSYASDNTSAGNLPGETVMVDILANDEISEGVPATVENATVILINPITDLPSETPYQVIIPGQGIWTYNPFTGLLSFSPETGFTGNPTPLNYRLCKIDLTTSCSLAQVIIFYEVISPEPSIALVKTGTYSAETETIDYTFTVTNLGNVPLLDIVIDDDRIGVSNLGVETVTLAPGETINAFSSYKITQEDLDEGRVVNSASVRSTDISGILAEDISGTGVSNDEPTTTLIDQIPALEIEKEAVLFSQEVAINEVVDFNIFITNTGNVTLGNLIVSDPLTGFEEEAGTLTPGSVVSFATNYTVQSADERNGQVENVAFVSGTAPNGSIIENSSSVTVQVEQCEIVIPNAFSPNDDGIQDTWRIKCIEKYPEARVEIYNRWGNRVFEKDNFGNTDIHGSADAWWDGYSSQKLTFGNEKLPTGTYYYILNLNDGSEPINGFIFMNW